MYNCITKPCLLSFVLIYVQHGVCTFRSLAKPAELKCFKTGGTWQIRPCCMKAEERAKSACAVDSPAGTNVERTVGRQSIVSSES